MIKKSLFIAFIASISYLVLMNRKNKIGPCSPELELLINRK